MSIFDILPNWIRYTLYGLTVSGGLFVIGALIGMGFYVYQYWWVITPIIFILIGLIYGVAISRIYLKKRVNDSYWILGLATGTLIATTTAINIFHYIAYLILGALISGVPICLLTHYKRNSEDEFYERLRYLVMGSYLLMGFLLIISLFWAGVIFSQLALMAGLR
jgi:hypothetical protein